MALDFLGAKEKIEQALADVQAEVGSFLMKKALILRLPDMPAKAEMLARQAELENAATAFVSEATDIKSRIPDELSWRMALEIPKYISLIEDAYGVATKGLELRADMLAHIQTVDNATAGIEEKQAQEPQTPMQAEYSQNTKVALGLGAMLLIYMVMRKK